MVPLYSDPHYTFHFVDDRLIPRFHLEGMEIGRRIVLFRVDPLTGAWCDKLATACVGEGGWVELPVPLVVRAGESFVAVSDPAVD